MPFNHSIIRNPIFVLCQWCLLLTFCHGFHEVAAQQQFDILNPVDISWKKARRMSRDLKMPILAVTYTTSNRMDENLYFKPGDNLDFVDSMIVVVINWDQNRRHPLFEEIKNSSNPGYMVVHHEETVLAKSKNNFGKRELLTSIQNGRALFYRLEAIQARLKNDRKNRQAQRDLIQFYARLPDLERTDMAIDKFYNGNPSQISMGDLRFLVSIAEACRCNNDIYELIKSREKDVLTFYNRRDLLKLKQNMILNQLSVEELLFPSIVWEIYEADFGSEADSLYRLFAISYYQVIEPNKAILLDEVIDFIYLYKDAPWSLQDELFGLALTLTDKKEDLELLLDLVSYHYFKEPNYRNLDYRALLLYKLGQEERAIGMIQEVMQMALDAGVLYKSLLHDVRNDDK